MDSVPHAGQGTGVNVLAVFAWLPLLAIGVFVAGRLVSWPRAAGAARGAALVLAVVWLAVRLCDFLAKGGGPMRWAFVGTPTAATAEPLVSATLRLGIGAGVVLAAATLAIAKVWHRAIAPVALRGIAGVVAALCALLVAGTFAAGPLPFATALPLDVAAFVPAIAAAIAVSFAVAAPRGTHVVPTVISLMPREVTAPQAEAEARLRKAGLIDAPAFTSPVTGSVAHVGETDEIDRVWDACGGAGAAPGALRAALAATGGVVVCDLPVPTEEAVVDAAALVTMFDARRVLVIAADAVATRDRILGRAAVLGGWRAGLVVAGEGELAAAMAAGQVPALIVLSPRDLGGKALGVAGWVGIVDRVILVGADQLAPIASTHAVFALRRLRLALDRERARVSWIATGASGVHAPRFLELATRARFDVIPLAPAWTARTATHVRAGGDADAELATARTSIENLPEVALAAPVWRGAVGLARVEDRQLAGLYRARTQLAHRIAGNAHTGVWWIDDTPLSKFLLRDGVLAGLAQQGELPAARPVVGLANQFLAAAHLEAALAEGAPDATALRWAFGDDAIGELLAARPEIRTGARRARWSSEGHAVVTSPVLAVGASAWTDPRRDTVTANAVDVKSSIDGSVVARVDRRTAATRMYPHRVFRARGVLWQIPAAANDLRAPSGSGAITASPSTEPSTSPELEVTLGTATWTTRPEQHTAGKVMFARAVATLAIAERVTGAIAHGAATASVRYAPVTADYTTSAVVLMFETVTSQAALRHAGRLAAELVPALVRVERDDLELVLAPDGLGGVARPALVFVDRHPDGLGLADALGPATVHDLLRWTWGVLYRCPCVAGCASCTPADVLAAGADKLGALKLLGG